MYLCTRGSGNYFRSRTISPSAALMGYEPICRDIPKAAIGSKCLSFLLDVVTCREPSGATPSFLGRRRYESRSLARWYDVALRSGHGRRNAHILRSPKIMIVVAEVELQSVEDPFAGVDDLLAILDRIAMTQLVACLLDDPHRVVEHGFCESKAENSVCSEHFADQRPIRLHDCPEVTQGKAIKELVGLVAAGNITDVLRMADVVKTRQTAFTKAGLTGVPRMLGEAV